MRTAMTITLMVLCTLLVSGLQDYVRASNSNYVVKNDDCIFYFARAATTDPKIVSLLSQVDDGGAVRICTSVEGQLWFYEASPIYNQSGVILYSLSQVFYQETNVGHSWVSDPPKELKRLQGLVLKTVFMCIDKDICNRQSDDGFVSTDGITPYLFGVLSDSWRTISKSEELFRKAASNLTEAEKSSSEFKSFMEFVFEGDSKGARIGGAVFYRDGFSGGSQRLTLPHYEFFIIQPNNSKVWAVAYEYHGGGIKFLRIGHGTI